MKIRRRAEVASDEGALPPRHGRPRFTCWQRGLMLVFSSLVMAAASLVSTGVATAGPASTKVDSDYTLLRSAPASWVIGTAYRDWSARDEGVPGTYAWARVGGDLHRCVWIYRDATTPGGRDVAGSCGAPRQHTDDEFKRLFTNGMIGSNKAGNDGAPALLRPHGDCAVHNGKVDGWGNVKPWLATTEPTRRLREALTVGVDGTSTSNGHPVKWRYVTRDGKFVMVHATRYDPNEGRGHQNWFFVQRSCLQLNPD